METLTLPDQPAVENRLREAAARGALPHALIFSGPGDRLAAAHVTNYSLSNFDAVCQVAAEEGKIRPEDIDRLKKFRANPSDESWIRAESQV